jgi:serine/threonine protein kinase
MPQLAKYELLEELGHGGMATVYLARDRRLGREVAVKVIHPHLRDSREVVSRFYAEAKAVAKLRHPNIVDVYDVSEPDEADQYLVVGLVRGTTLRKLLQERGAMPPEIAAALGLELLAALAHANANGLVHRDVKPENVLVARRTPGDVAHAGPDERSHEPDGPPVAVKLTDFGIAKLLDQQGVTSTGQVLGSPAHMAPEQIEGGEVDARADVFGVGVLLYECMVGHLPFDGANPAQVLRRVLDGDYAEAQRERPAIGAHWSKILDRALARAPADRYPDANAMRDAVTAELLRLELASPDRELAAWIDDPSRFGESDRKRTVDRLCVLAKEARRRGDVLGAAADYNRALANAPDDPNLMRIVAGMNRAERRARAMRRGARVAAAAIGLGTLAFASMRLVHSRPAPKAPALVATQPSAVDTAAPVAASAVVGLPSTSPPPRAPAVTLREAAQPRVSERKVTLDLKPPMGVSLSIDGQPTRGVSTGDALTMGSRAHTLSFSCPVCVSVQFAVEAGDRDSTLVVSVPVKPATLVVDGDVSRTYQIVEHPELVVRAGPNTVPLRSTYEPVTVSQIGGDAVSVRLEAAKTLHVAFP